MARRPTFMQRVRKILPRDRKVTVQLKFRMEPETQTADFAIGALRALVDNDGEGLHSMMREVVIATLFKAYAERFRSRIPISRKLLFGNTSLSIQRRAAYLVRMQEHFRSKNQEKFGSDAYNRHEQLESSYRQAYTGSKDPKEERPGKQIRLRGGESATEVKKSLFDQERSGGKFTDRMQLVIAKFLQAQGMRNSGRANSVTVSFGNIPLMEQGEKAKTSLRNKGEFNVMWRQLEFGSGFYAKAAGNRVSVPRTIGTFQPKLDKHSKEYYEIDPQTGKKKKRALTDGSWMLGGLRIIGSRPGNWLRDQTGGQYEGDALLFESVFATRLSQELRRRSK